MNYPSGLVQFARAACKTHECAPRHLSGAGQEPREIRQKRTSEGLLDVVAVESRWSFCNQQK
jgi:hypothetical protein